MNPLTKTLKKRLPGLARLNTWVEQFVNDMPALQHQAVLVIRRAQNLAERWREHDDDFWDLAHVYADAVDCAVSRAGNKRRSRRTRKRYRILLISDLCWRGKCPVNLFAKEDMQVLCDALEELNHPLLDVLRRELTFGDKA